MCFCDSIYLWWMEKGIRLHGVGIRADCDHHELGDIKFLVWAFGSSSLLNVGCDVLQIFKVGLASINDNHL